MTFFTLPTNSLKTLVYKPIFKKEKNGQYVQNTITLETLLTVLKVIISEEILYDIKNAAIILCDSKLEAALNINGLHVKDVKECVLKQLICLTPPQSQTNKKRKACEDVISQKM
jgi:hypothetical protein